METVEVSQLLVLPHRFVALPPQVLEAYICNIKPRDGDQDWPLEVILLYSAIFVYNIGN